MTPSGYNPFNDDIEKEFSWITGLQLRGLSVTFREIDVLVVFKAWDDRGKPVVTFCAGPTFERAWEYLQENYESREVFLKWKRDKFHKVDKWGNDL